MKKKKHNPSPTADNGRDNKGKFTRGNRCARGNPHARQVQKLRSALLSAIKPSDIKIIVRKLIERAKAGDIVAAKEIFDRTIGKPIEMDFLERLEGLEKMLAEIEK